MNSSLRNLILQVDKTISKDPKSKYIRIWIQINTSYAVYASMSANNGCVKSLIISTLRNTCGKTNKSIKKHFDDNRLNKSQ